MIELGYQAALRHPLITPILKSLGGSESLLRAPIHESALQGFIRVIDLSVRLHRLPYEARYVLATEKGYLGREEPEVYCHLSLDDGEPESYLWISSLSRRGRGYHPDKHQYRKVYALNVKDRGTVGELLKTLSIYDVLQPLGLRETALGTKTPPSMLIFPNY